MVLDFVKHVLLLLAGPIQPWPDSYWYWKLGSDAAQGDWWLTSSEIAYRTPVYPWFLALLQWLCGRYALLAAVLCQHVMELAVSWLTASAVWHITRSRWSALVAYGCCVVMTARPLFANVILTESCAVLLSALCLWLMSLPAFFRSRKVVAIAAVTLGVAILERPAAVAFLPALMWAAVTLVADGSSWRLRGQRLVLSLGLIAAVLFPWCLRNALVWQRFTVSVFLGRELWAANFSPWPGAHLVVPETGPGLELRERLRGQPVNLQHNWSVATALRGQGMNDVALDDLMKTVSIQAVRESPRQAGLHFAARCLWFWYVKDWEQREADNPPQDAWRDQATWSNAENRRWLRYWLQWTPERFFRPTWCWSAITWLGVLGLIVHPQRRNFGIMLAGLLLGLTVLTAALEIPCYRYRCIAEPAMIVAAVAGTASIQLRRRSENAVPRR